MGKLIPLVLALIGLGAGVGAGIALRPEPEAAAMDETHPCGDITPLAEPAEKPKPVAPETPTDFAKMANQFVIPLISDDAVTSMVVMSLSLEVVQDQVEAVYEREPKLRDAFLRVLLDHANSGGFDGAFTSNGAMDTLRRALSETAYRELGDVLIDVLIQDINRQDL